MKKNSLTVIDAVEYVDNLMATFLIIFDRNEKVKLNPVYVVNSSSFIFRKRQQIKMKTITRKRRSINKTFLSGNSCFTKFVFGFMNYGTWTVVNAVTHFVYKFMSLQV